MGSKSSKQRRAQGKPSRAANIATNIARTVGGPLTQAFLPPMQPQQNVGASVQPSIGMNQLNPDLLSGLSNLGGIPQSNVQSLLTPEQQAQDSQGFFNKLISGYYSPWGRGGQWMMGKEDPQLATIPRFGIGQYGLLGNILGAGAQGLKDNPFDFSTIAKQATDRFQQQTVPGLAERFAGLGALGSSGFNRQIAQAGRDFQGDLAAQQSNFNIQRQQPLNQLLQLGLTEPYLSNLSAGNPGMFGPLAGLALKTALAG